MATQGLYIDARQLTQGAKRFEQLTKLFPDKVSDVLNANAKTIEAKAKRAAPADRGPLRQGISTELTNPLKKHITSHAPYSAYVEFGTGVYAAQYVSSLPADYQTFAAQFKRGRRWPPIKLIAEWVKRKGLAGTYSVKTKRRTGSRATRQKEDLQLAYVIARAIFKKGIHPHPFMIPALIDQQPKIVKDMINLLDKLKF